jgi:diaminopimelate decarboxylase
MDAFGYKRGELYCEGVPARRIAEEVGTPAYVYSAQTILDHFGKIRQAFAAVDPLICYSVKANSNLAVLALLHRAGAGFDIVSGGELFRVLKIGADPRKVVFAGVGKRSEEVGEALRTGVLFFNVESEGELMLVDRIARKVGRRVDVTIRVNPDVDPSTHRYITTGKRENKFGLSFDRAGPLIEKSVSLEGIRVRGLHVHIGSQITDPTPFRLSLERTIAFLDRAVPAGKGKERWLNCGGGFGIHYRGREGRPAEAFAEVMVPLVRGAGCRLILEPGRFIVGNAGILLTRVLFVKELDGRRCNICDAGMNDLIRPSLYGAFHHIWPVCSRFDPRGEEVPAAETVLSDVVGPICETGDFFAHDRPLPPLSGGELLSVYSAGAYGFTMSSNYNSHPRATEVLVEGDRYRVVRKRESYDDLVRGEGV